MTFAYSICSNNNNDNFSSCIKVFISSSIQKSLTTPAKKASLPQVENHCSERCILIYKLQNHNQFQ